MTTYRQIAELWAQQATKGPKAAGRFWRRDHKAGHFRSTVAQLVNGPDGAPIAMIWDSHWGTGTAAMLNACEDEAKKCGIPAFRVPSILANPVHRENLDYFEKQAQDCEERIPRAHSVDWQARADAFRAEAERYKKAFALE